MQPDDFDEILQQKQSWENIWRWNVNENITNNYSPSNIWRKKYLCFQVIFKSIQDPDDNFKSTS